MIMWSVYRKSGLLKKSKVFVSIFGNSGVLGQYSTIHSIRVGSSLSLFIFCSGFRFRDVYRLLLFKISC